MCIFWLVYVCVTEINTDYYSSVQLMIGDWHERACEHLDQLNDLINHIFSF
jgi:hypothetical protein